jgi:hypothetical protein
VTLRVVNLGLPKTGTTTLSRALRRANLRTADHRVRANQITDPEAVGQPIAQLLYKGYFETGDPGHFVKEFDALAEISLLQPGLSLWPQTDFALLRALKLHHPAVKFLASQRDTFQISQSMLAWTNLGTERLPRNDVPGLPAGYGVTTKEREQWIDGHYDNLKRMFADDPDFMIFDVSDPDAQRKVSDFLGIELPWWGQANQNRAMV